MQKIIFLGLSLVLMVLGYWDKQSMLNEREYVICHAELPIDDMKIFASDPTFQALHLSPVPISFQAKGEMISFSTPDGKTGSGYFIKAKDKSDKWLFVYQEWWGLNDHIKMQSDRFYDDLREKVNVIALDMYDGKIATDPKVAGQLMQGAQESRLESIVMGAKTFAGTKAKIAQVGWCFGGSWSLKSGLIQGKQNVGVVMYYGMPVRDVERLKTLNSDVLGLFATEKYISKEIIEEFATNMKLAGKELEYKIFDGVHGFANPSNPKYDMDKATEAYTMALAYLKKRLKV
ncbi:MAG: dienelactone hydrolase family protein [Bacteroidota bacterium]